MYCSLGLPCQPSVKAETFPDRPAPLFKPFCSKMTPRTAGTVANKNFSDTKLCSLKPTMLALSPASPALVMSAVEGVAPKAVESRLAEAALAYTTSKAWTFVGPTTTSRVAVR